MHVQIKTLQFIIALNSFSYNQPSHHEWKEKTNLDHRIKNHILEKLLADTNINCFVNSTDCNC